MSMAYLFFADGYSERGSKRRNCIYFDENDPISIQQAQEQIEESGVFPPGFRLETYCRPSAYRVISKRGRSVDWWERTA